VLTQCAVIYNRRPATTDWLRYAAVCRYAGLLASARDIGHIVSARVELGEGGGAALAACGSGRVVPIHCRLPLSTLERPR